MEIEVLGIGNAFTALNHQTSFVIRANRTYLVDGPQGLFRLLHKRGISRSAIDDVIITHIHGDHVSGLETLLVWKKSFEKKKVRLHTSSAVFEELNRCFFSSFSRGFNPDLKEIVSKQFEDYVDFVELRENERNPLESEVFLEIRHNWHPTPTLGLKVSSRGRTISISGDTCYRPLLLQELRSLGILTERRFEHLAGDWLWDADMIYHEADGSPNGPHTFEGDLLLLPLEIRRKIRLVHVPDEFKAKGLPIAKEGERLKVTRKGKLIWNS
jgi:ribonuclease BN (tRNA processing enzyme)